MLSVLVRGSGCNLVIWNGARSSHFSAAWLRGRTLYAPSSQTRFARIGYLSQESLAFDRSHGDSAAFRDALGDLGYVEGKNLHIEFRYADANLDRLPALAAELVGLNVDIIVTYSAGTFAAREDTRHKHAHSHFAARRRGDRVKSPMSRISSSRHLLRLHKGGRIGAVSGLLDVLETALGRSRTAAFPYVLRS